MVTPVGPVTPPGPQERAASLTAATAGVVVWTVERYVFGGTVPGPVYGFLMLAVPWLCGHVGAELAYRRARRRLDCPKAP